MGGDSREVHRLPAGRVRLSALDKGAYSHRPVPPSVTPCPSYSVRRSCAHGVHAARVVHAQVCAWAEAHILRGGHK